MQDQHGTNGNRRRHLRTPLILAARFDLGREATIVDLSVGGVRLEHHGILRPGAECRVRFALNDEVYLFTAGVMWSRAVEGGSRLLFHSGLAFERMPGAVKPLLAEMVGAG